MLYHIVTTSVSEAFEVLFKICLGALALGSDCHGCVLIEVGAWACLEEMGSLLINSSNQESDTERSLGWMASLGLTLGGQFVDHSLDWVLATMSVPVVQRFVPHVLVDVPGISSEPREGNTQVIIAVEDLLLMRSQFMG
jgi:hypothetical protein